MTKITQSVYVFSHQAKVLIFQSKTECLPSFYRSSCFCLEKLLMVGVLVWFGYSEGQKIFRVIFYHLDCESVL